MRSCVCAVGSLAMVGCSILTDLNGLTGGAADGGAADGGVDARPDVHDAGTDQSPVEASPADTGQNDATRTDASQADANIHDALPDVPPPPPLDGGDAGSIYMAAVLADNPLAYWRFGEASGTVARDSSGHGYDATYSGCTLGVPGALVGDPDTAASFDGIASSVFQASPVFDFTGQQAFTIEGWFRPRTIAATDYHHLINRETQSGNRQGYAAFLTSSGNLGFERFVNGSNAIAGGPSVGPVPPLNVYTYVVGTYDGATLALYVNGTLFQSTADARQAVALVDGLYVGAGETVKFLDGDADEVAVYATALPATRIAAHFQAAQ